MAPRRRRHLPMTDEAFLDDPELVLIRPIPTADAVGGGENFDVRVGDKVGHKVGLIIRSYLQSDGRRRSLTDKRRSTFLRSIPFGKTSSALYPGATMLAAKPGRHHLRFSAKAMNALRRCA